MKELAQTAIRLDPGDGHTHLAMGLYYVYSGQMTKAKEEYGRALELSPHDADVLLISAWGMPFMGEPDRGVQLSEMAVTLNPRFPSWYLQGLRTAYYFGRQYQKASEYNALIVSPTLVDHVFAAMSLAELGNEAEARRQADLVKREQPGWNAERWISDQGGFARAEEADLALDGASKAGLAPCASAAEIAAESVALRNERCDRQRSGEAVF